MKKVRLVCILCAILMVWGVSCSSNLQVKKEQEESLRDLGEAYMGQGNYTAALRELFKAERLYSKDPYLQNDLGITYMAKKKFGQAIKHFQKALELKPDYAPAKNSLGIAYLKKGDLDTAISIFKELSQDILYGTPQYPLTNLGSVYFNKKDYFLAEKYYQEALDIRPNFINALIGIGKTHIKMGKISEAIKELEKASEISPAIPDVHYYLANAYSISGDYKKALNAYSKVIALAPDSLLAEKAKQDADKIKNFDMGL